MFKPTNANAIKLLAEIESGWMDSFAICNSVLPSELADKRQGQTEYINILPKLEIKEKINSTKNRKAELLTAYANGETPLLTVEEESRIGRNEEAFYGLLVRWGIVEPITEDDLLDL